MPRDKLKNALETIREELSSSREFDDQTRSLLEDLDREIDNVLMETSESAPDRSLANEVEAMTARFEADHPRLGQVLREVSDALSKLGL
jgi:U3 small nucleolar ribonucleoprotein component